MTDRCALCGIMSGESLCLHHSVIYTDEWAESNRAMCDFFHRHKVQPNEPTDKEWFRRYGYHCDTTPAQGRD